MTVNQVKGIAKGGSGGMIQVSVRLREQSQIEIQVRLPANATCRDALEASGLQPRDGTPCFTWNDHGHVIDRKLAHLYDTVLVGPPQLLQHVWIESENYSGTEGIGYLEDGTQAYVPGMQEGEFGWIYVTRRWSTKGAGSRCHATRVRVDDEHPYRAGDRVRLNPHYSKDIHFLYNPLTGKPDLPIEVTLSGGVEREQFEGINWIVMITSTQPLLGRLLDEETYVPEHQPNLARQARIKEAKRAKKRAKKIRARERKKAGFTCDSNGASRSDE